jgi:hypothetical protein
MDAFAWLAKELRKLDPAELQLLFEGEDPVPAADALEAVMDSWASDASSVDEQRAAVCEREKAVAKEQQALQQLVVHIAGMAKSTAHLT